MRNEKFAAGFYSSIAWQQCRESYARSKAWTCERCGEPGTQVHHKTRLSRENLMDAEVSLCWDNLELLCDACHIEEHKQRRSRAKRRYKVAEDGSLVVG